jgi:glycine cleavage system aminomethyltransferase T
VVHRGQGRVARRIVGVRVVGDVVPARGDTVLAGEREAGRVTSAAWSPRANAVVALAMLHRDFVEPGTALSVRHGDQRLGATVAALPFVE